ncbi:MAG: LptF/LptG family permease, partial [Flavobacteriales bacterium]
MFKTLDKYIIKKILKTFFFSIICVLCIIVVFDISEKIDDFLRSKLSVPQLLTQYYAGFVIHIGNMFFPLFVLITIVMVTLKLNQRSEITAILSTGISFRRLLRPFFIGVGLIVLFSFYINFVLLPKANQKRMAFENVYTGYASVLSGVHFEVVPGTIVSYKSYNFKKMKYVSELWMDKYIKDESGLNKLNYSLYANYAYGDSVSNKFELKNVTERYYLPEGDSILKYKTRDTTLSFGLKDLGQRNEVVSTMYFDELLAFRDKEKQKGSAIVPFIEIEMYSRTSNPLSLFILALLGVCISISP